MAAVTQLWRLRFFDSIMLFASWNGRTLSYIVQIDNAPLKTIVYREAVAGKIFAEYAETIITAGASEKTNST